MLITKENLNEVLFENHDARLLIEDIVIHTEASVYYYPGTEFTLDKALKLWRKINKAENCIVNPIKHRQTHQNRRTLIICDSLTTCTH